MLYNRLLANISKEIAVIKVQLTDMKACKQNRCLFCANRADVLHKLTVWNADHALYQLKPCQLQGTIKHAPVQLQLPS